MKALIIGNTRGIGKAISDQFVKNGWSYVGVSRAEKDPQGINHYRCDISNPRDWQSTLEEIKEAEGKFDALVCIAGYAVPKKSKDLTRADWEETMKRNLFYVTDVVKIFTGENSEQKVITIGSQWSYKIGRDELVPYIVAKHSLRTFCEDVSARMKNVDIRHYCVPTTDTPAFQGVKEDFISIGRLDIVESFTAKGLADASIVGTAIVQHFLNKENKSITFLVEGSGIIKPL